VGAIQVEPDHYDWASYILKGRWVSFWHQVQEVRATGAATCVEIGVGPGIVRQALAGAGVAVTCVDIDPGLGVDRVGDVRSLPCSDGEFDVVLCSQVLEHLPWADVPQAVAELRRTCRTHAIVSLPQSGPSVGIGIDLWRVRRSVATRVPLPFRHRFDGQHYWQVGARGTQRPQVRATLSQGFEIEREYTVPEFSYHRFYVLRAV
jgi:Methyltransferase domain